MRACICEGVFDGAKVVNIRYSSSLSASTSPNERNNV